MFNNLALKLVPEPYVVARSLLTNTVHLQRAASIGSEGVIG